MLESAHTFVFYLPATAHSQGYKRDRVSDTASLHYIFPDTKEFALNLVY